MNTANDEDRAWLMTHYDNLRQQYDKLPEPPSLRVIHGDAWQGTLIVAPSGVPTVLDLDKVSVGRPEWDLIQLAVDYTDFSRISASEYRSFVEAYGGHDITGGQNSAFSAIFRNFGGSRSPWSEPTRAKPLRRRPSTDSHASAARCHCRGGGRRCSPAEVAPVTSRAFRCAQPSRNAGDARTQCCSESSSTIESRPLWGPGSSEHSPVQPAQPVGQRGCGVRRGPKLRPMGNEVVL